MTAHRIKPLTTSTEEWVQFLSAHHPNRGESERAVECFRQWAPQVLDDSELTVWWDTREALGDKQASSDHNIGEWASKPRLRCTHRVYFAVKGRTFDPTPHLPNLLSSGCFVIAAKGTRVQLERSGCIGQCTGYVLEVPDPTTLLRTFCNLKLAQWSNQLRTIGVTGTNGKTSVTHILSHVLRQCDKRRVAQLGTLGFHDGLSWYPNTFPTTPGLPDFTRIVGHLIHNQIDTLVMEVSSHALTENRLGNWRLDVAILTNITPDHLDFHKTLEAYTEAKLRIFRSHIKEHGHAIICAEKSPWFKALSCLSPDASFCLATSEALPQSTLDLITTNPGRRARASALLSSTIGATTLHQRGLRFRISEWSSDGKPDGFESATFVVPSLYGHFQLHNTLVSVAAATASGLSPAEIVTALTGLPPIPGRMERVALQDHSFLPAVFIDYAHTADALQQALISLRQLRANPTQKIWVVFGCGGDRDSSKRPEMGRVAAEYADRLIVTSDNPRSEDPMAIISQIRQGIADTSRALAEPDRARAIERAVLAAEPLDLILVAGKGHEDYQIIGNMKTDFSDHEQASVALKKRKEQQCSTP